MTGATRMTPEAIAANLGLKRSGREWRGTCPACGYGSGAFVLSIAKGGKVQGWCACCRNVETIRKALGGELPPVRPMDADKEQETVQRRRDRARALWHGAVPVPGTPGYLYLQKRGLPWLATSIALRYRPDTPHPKGGGKHAALIAAVTDFAGDLLAVHRTYITRDGQKADVEPVRATLALLEGGAIRLEPFDCDKPLVIGEGIETSASAGRLIGTPAWSAVASANLGHSLRLPPEVRSVVVAADPDDPGERAAVAAALRWRAEGREVRIARPEPGRGDFNDMLQEV